MATAKKAAAKKATTATQRAPAARKSGYALKTTATPVPVAEFLAAVPDPQRRADAEVVLELMREATGEAPVMWGPSIVGFGRYRYQLPHQSIRRYRRHYGQRLGHPRSSHGRRSR